MANRLEAPIPGMSLTDAPRNRPYERPPQIVDVEEAIQMHVGRLSEKSEDVINALEMGLDVETLTKGLLRSAVAEGVHTLDVALLIAPAIHEFIKTTAQSIQVDFDEGFENEQETEDRRKAISSSKYLHSVLSGKGPMGKKEDFLDGEEEEADDETPAERPLPTGGGFMTRPTKGEM